MIKRLTIVKRRAGMSKQDFRAHWLGPHAEIALRLPGLRGYVVDLPLTDDVEVPDGVAEVWFDDVDSAEAAFADPSIAAALAEDRPRFIETSTTFFTDEHVLRQPPAARSSDP